MTERVGKDGRGGGVVASGIVIGAFDLGKLHRVLNLAVLPLNLIEWRFDIHVGCTAFTAGELAGERAYPGEARALAAPSRIGGRGNRDRSQDLRDIIDFDRTVEVVGAVVGEDKP